MLQPPWRLVRAITARWYQWAREASPEPDVAQLEKLQTALCKSTYAFHLPPNARKGSPLRQYHPTEFGWRPAEKKKAGTRSYGTSLVQDNYWCVPPGEPVWWFLEGDDWSDDLPSQAVVVAGSLSALLGHSMACLNARRADEPIRNRA